MKKLFILAIAAVGLLACTEKNNPNNPSEQGKTDNPQEYMNPNAVDGALPGKFSVSASRKVQFSQGNLQYCARTNTWRFAINQYDTIGMGNENISASYTGWIDLFGWGTGNNPTNTSDNEEDYQEFIDWGINKIANGGSRTDQWYTMSGKEWQYLLINRPNAQNLFGTGKVNGICGLIILPDNWSIPQGVTFVPGGTKGNTDGSDGYYYSDSDIDIFDYNAYTISEWTKMEKSGAVFLPMAEKGCVRAKTEINNTNHVAFYWYSTPLTDDYVQLAFWSYPSNNDGKWSGWVALWGNWTSPYYGMLVRLAKEAQ